MATNSYINVNSIDNYVNRIYFIKDKLLKQ